MGGEKAGGGVLKLVLGVWGSGIQGHEALRPLRLCDGLDGFIRKLIWSPSRVVHDDFFSSVSLLPLAVSTKNQKEYTHSYSSYLYGQIHTDLWFLLFII